MPVIFNRQVIHRVLLVSLFLIYHSVKLGPSDIGGNTQTISVVWSRSHTNKEVTCNIQFGVSQIKQINQPVLARN